MKNFKILILFSLLFGLFFNNNIFAYNINYTKNNLETVQEKLSEIKNGEKYISRIDEIVLKYKEREDLIIKKQKKISEIRDALDKSNVKYKEDLLTLVDYFDIKLYFALQEITLKNEDLEDELNEKDDLITEDKNNSNNEENYDKGIYPGFSDNYEKYERNIIAGEDYIVYSGKTSSLYESIEVGKVIFYISGPDVSDLKNSVDYATLYLEGLELKKASASNIDIINSGEATITFKNVDNFIIPKKEVKFRLGIKPNSIGYQKSGKTIKDIYVSEVKLDDATGVTSGRDTSSFISNDVEGEPFTIAPGTLLVSTINSLSTTRVPEINIKALFGDNTIDSNNSTPKINLSKIKFSIIDNSGTANFKIVNTADTSDSVTGIVNGSILEFDLSTLNSTNRSVSEGKGENFKIFITGTDSGVSLELLKDGIEYNVEGVSGANDLNINMQNNLDLGYRDF